MGGLGGLTRFLGATVFEVFRDSKAPSMPRGLNFATPKPREEDAYCFRRLPQRCRSEEINRVSESLRDKGFEIQFQSHAAAILEIDFPEAIKELEEALRGLVIPIGEIIGSGGGETKVYGEENANVRGCRQQFRLANA